MAHDAEIVHHVRGRLRMKIKKAKGDECLLEQIRQAMVSIPGVREVTVNPTTGSIVLNYDPEDHGEFHQRLQDHSQEHICVCHPPRLQIDQMADAIDQEAEFLAEHSHAARAVVTFCKDVDRQIKVASNNTVDLKVLVPLGLAVYTFTAIGVQAATPIWLTLGLFALNHFVEMHAHPNQPQPAF
jgi:cation transport ATPase